MGRIYLSPPDVGETERSALLAAFDSGWIAPVGPELERFERTLGAITGRRTVALASGTAALHLALLQVGVGRDEDVIVSSFTFAASANAVAYCGARPVFVDSESASWNMSPDLLEELLAGAARAGRLPRAVVVVDLYGQCADYERIEPMCREYGVPLIEDAAEALGATAFGRPAGSFGDIAAVSFNGNKIITTSGGGALLAADDDTAARARYLATQARQPAVHYEHTEIGFNYRMSNLLAALGTAQLERLPGMSARRRAVNDLYRTTLGAHVEFMPVPTWSEWNGWLSCIVLPDRATRDHVMAALDAQDIESRPLWKPLHLQPVFADAPSLVDGTAEHLFDTGLCLPSGSALSDDDVARIAGVVTASL